MEPWEDELESGNRHLFKDWANNNIPRVTAGVYTIWDTEGKFMYVGIAGADLTKEEIDKTVKENKIKGLLNRLKHHYSGNRSSDAFCTLIFDRIILPKLSRKKIKEASRGELNLDLKVKDYISRYLSYRYHLTKDASKVRDIEDHIKRGAWKAGLKPFLNPSP